MKEEVILMLSELRSKINEQLPVSRKKVQQMARKWCLC